LVGAACSPFNDKNNSPQPQYVYKNQVYLEPYANQPVNITPLYEKKLRTPIDDRTRVEVTNNYMGSPDVVLTKEIKCLGVYEVDPDEYERAYSNELLNPEEIPDIHIELPNGHELASRAYYNELPPLVGDVEALKLIDLDKVGLGQYKPFVNMMNGYKTQANSSKNGTWNNVQSTITGQSDHTSLRSSNLSPYFSQSSHSSMNSNYN
jgi:hypothetical protein